MAGKGDAAAKDEAETKQKGGKKKLIIMIVPVVLVVAGAAGWFFFLKPSGSDETPAPVPGEVVAMDAITINLAGGHFLKLGLALQATESAHEVSGEKALDAAIGLYSGMTIEELSTKKGRAHTKEELVEEVEELYHHEVYDVYFTEFVYQ